MVILEFEKWSLAGHTITSLEFVFENFTPAVDHIQPDERGLQLRYPLLVCGCEGVAKRGRGSGDEDCAHAK